MPHTFFANRTSLNKAIDDILSGNASYFDKDNNAIHFGATASDDDHIFYWDGSSSRLYENNDGTGGVDTKYGPVNSWEFGVDINELTTSSHKTLYALPETDQNGDQLPGVEVPPATFWDLSELFKGKSLKYGDGINGNNGNWSRFEESGGGSEPYLNFPSGINDWFRNENDDDNHGSRIVSGLHIRSMESMFEETKFPYGGLDLSNWFQIESLIDPRQMVLLNLNGTHKTPKKANGNNYNNVTDIYDDNVINSPVNENFGGGEDYRFDTGGSPSPTKKFKNMFKNSENLEVSNVNKWLIDESLYATDHMSGMFSGCANFVNKAVTNRPYTISEAQARGDIIVSDAIIEEGTPLAYQDNTGEITSQFFNYVAGEAVASGDPHIKCLDGTVCDFRYHGFLRLFEIPGLIINVNCSPGYNQSSKMEYFRDVYIKIGNDHAIINMGWRGKYVTITENTGILIRAFTKDFDQSARRHCETCRGWSSNEDALCVRHMKRHNHVVSELIRNKLLIEYKNIEISFENVNRFNGQPCSINIKGRIGNKKAGLLVGPEWASICELESLDDDVSLLPCESLTC